MGQNDRSIKMDHIQVEKAMRTVLESVGFNFNEGTEKTPKRFIKYLREMCSKPEEFEWTTFDSDSTDQMVAVGPISFSSACEHHLLPFFGKAYVSYIPNKKLVGLSKLPRVVEYFSRAFQTQEYLTNAIGRKLAQQLETENVGVVMVAEHTCMSCRGVRSEGATTRTSYLSGVFKSEPDARQEFFNLIK